MISKNRFFSILFLLGLFPGMIISCEWVKFADELLCLFVLVLVGMDIVQNGWKAIRRQKSLWIFLSIMLLYAIYSVTFVHYNGFLPVVSDMISQAKPFLPLLVAYNLRLEFEPQYRPIGRILCLVNVVMMVVFFIVGGGRLELPFGHIAFLGAICLVSGCSYLYFSIDAKTGLIPRRAIVVAMVCFVIGLICGRSKYYGEFITIIAMLFFYRTGMFRTITLPKVLAAFALLAVIVAVTWSKIEYYFIQGAREMMATSSLEEMSESFARPMMYYTGYQVLLDHIPFGSGLASFGSAASASSYSDLYFDYGLDQVWGLSPTYSSFICDAYYPTLCQFGIVGFLLFAYFWFWVIGRLNYGEQQLGERFRYPYVIGIIFFCFVIIECVAGTVFIQVQGLLAMMLMGVICSSVFQREDNKEDDSTHDISK